MAGPAATTRRAGVANLAAALTKGPVEVLDFVLPLWAGSALGLSPAAIGALTATETLVSFLSRPVAGVLADRVDRGRLAAAGAFLYALSFVGYALATGLPMALGAAVAGGIGGALFWVALRAKVAEGLREDSGVFAKLFAAEGTGTWIAFAAAVTLISRIDYRGVFWLCAAACAAAGVVLIGKAEPPATTTTPRLGSLGRRMWPLLGVVALTAVAEAGVALLLLLHLQRNYHLGLGAIAAVFLPGFIVYSTVPEFLHNVVTRLGRARVMTIALASSAVFAAILSLAPNPWTIAIAWVLAAAAFAAAIPVEQSVVAEAAGVDLGRGMAIYESANLLGATIGTFGAGILYGLDSGWMIACLSAAGLLVVAAVVIRPALARVGAIDRPETTEPPAEPEPEPEPEPEEKQKPKIPPLNAWAGHAVIYLVVQVALAFAGYSWPVEAIFSGPHDSSWFWNSSGHWLLNVGRIWTAIFLLDTVWSLGKVLLSRRR
ncbi:MFS transporter [Amycolatopsis jejuensis]|uniref:MFS transporter n=1 Tax=Amycolatopsis jejuensis TaxID=330084 RepID=UPI00052557BF|nr:MFS transporter [Amycolatopsis jejuensis]